MMPEVTFSGVKMVRGDGRAFNILCRRRHSRTVLFAAQELSLSIPIQSSRPVNDYSVRNRFDFLTVLDR